MKAATIILAAFAALAVASPIDNVQNAQNAQDVQNVQNDQAAQNAQAAQNDLYLSGDKPKHDDPPKAPVAPVSGCTACAKYCSDPSNGAALGAACYVVKCGIEVSVDKID